MELTDNKNFLAPLNFKFKLDSNKYPNLEYFCTGVSLPGLSITAVEQRYKQFAASYGSDSLQFDDLVIKFNISENMENYKETFDWIKSIALTENEYKCDATLHILSSHNNVVKEVKFFDVFPISLNGLEFDIQSESVEYLQGEVTFKYLRYEL
jgi:hypothetical protein